MASTPSPFFLIHPLNKLSARRMAEALKKTDLTVSQHMVLYLLSQHEPCCSADLAKWSYMTAQGMGEYIRTLEQRELVAKADAAPAGRAILLERTKQGKDLFNLNKQLIKQCEVEFLDRLSADDRHRLMAMLGSLRETEASREELVP